MFLPNLLRRNHLPKYVPAVETNAVDHLSSTTRHTLYVVPEPGQHGCQRSGHHLSSTEDTLKMQRSLIATLAVGMLVPAIASAHQFETVTASCVPGSGKVIVQVQAAFFPSAVQSATYVLEGLDASGAATTVTATGTFSAPGAVPTTITSPGIMGLASVTKVTASFIATDETTGTVSAAVAISGCAPVPPVVVPPVVVPPVVVPPVVVPVVTPLPAVIVASPAPVVTPVPPVPVVPVPVTTGAPKVKAKITTATRVFRHACMPGSGQTVTTRTTTTFPNGKKRVTIRVTGSCPRPKPAFVAVVG